MQRLWTIIGVDDVTTSVRWYQALLGLPGNGLLRFFLVDVLEAALARGRALVAQPDEEPHVNESTGAAEFAVRDPDGHGIILGACRAA